MSEQDELELDNFDPTKGKKISYTCLLITQGKHKLYTLAMPSDVLAQTCIADLAAVDSEDGFQRNLNERRAEEIAEYIDKDFGTIPGAIVLSAQKEANLHYNNKARTLSFNNNQRSFFILDGQHRVYGFRKATTHLRVPVVIYNNLSKSEEVRLFTDINTKQRPIPGELLLHIKRLAENEEDWEALLRKIFDLFNRESESPLLGLLSATERKPKKISRVTFNAALKPILTTISDSEPEHVYSVLKPYLHVWQTGLKKAGVEHNLVNPTLFKAIILLFPVVTQRLCDRFGEEFTVDNYQELMRPFFDRVKKGMLQDPGKGSRELFKTFADVFQAGFSLGGKRV